MHIPFRYINITENMEKSVRCRLYGFFMSSWCPVYTVDTTCALCISDSLSLSLQTSSQIRMSDYIFFISILVISFFLISSPHPSLRKTILMIRLLLLGFLIVFGCWEDIQVSTIQYFQSYFSTWFSALSCVCVRFDFSFSDRRYNVWILIWFCDIYQGDRSAGAVIEKKKNI